MTGPEPIPLKGKQFTLELVAEMIPFSSPRAVRDWLWRHRDLFPGHYRRVGSQTLRMLYRSEIDVIERMTCKPIPPSRWGHPRNTPRQAP